MTNGLRYRVGPVRFFNARPLIYGLEQSARVVLYPEAPAQLARKLDRGELEVALVPSIDYQRSQEHWRILPIAAIGSQGQVLTVRVFSQVPPDQIDTLTCDSESHTSVALAQIIWRKRYGKTLQARPLRGMAAEESAVLLIGDKVLNHLDRWAYQLDLGEAWTELTQLPFVYAFWAVREDFCDDFLVTLLSQAITRGLSRRQEIVDRYGKQHGFDRELGIRYLTENIRYEFGPGQKAALERFYALAKESQILSDCRELRMVSYGASEMNADGSEQPYNLSRSSGPL